MLNLKKIPTDIRLPLLSQYGEKAKNLTAKEAYFFLAYRLPDTRRSVIVLFDLAQDLLNAEVTEAPPKLEVTTVDDAAAGNVRFVDERGEVTQEYWDRLMIADTKQVMPVISTPTSGQAWINSARLNEVVEVRMPDGRKLSWDEYNKERGVNPDTGTPHGFDTITSLFGKNTLTYPATVDTTTAEPIPASIYYNPESDNFHEASTGHGKGTPFYVKWVDRKAEFYQSSKPLPIKVVETEAELSPTPVGYCGTILKSALDQLGKPIKFDPKAPERFS